MGALHVLAGSVCYSVGPDLGHELLHFSVSVKSLVIQYFCFVFLKAY